MMYEKYLYDMTKGQVRNHNKTIFYEGVTSSGIKDKDENQENKKTH